ncbi:MAG: MATE family efflux transporter [Oscillospiraceae bacterium]|nr:MATE family efflux transporter [Oscillospiraceae bacterium]
MNTKENPLGSMPIVPLLIKMSVPMMISMFVQAMYNIVDSMFVARISEDALTAVSLAFPIQMTMNAIAVGTGVGINACVSRFLGKGDHKSACKAANVQIFLSACYTLAFMILGIFFVRSFFLAQTDIESIVDGGVAYLRMICLLSVGSFFAQNFEKLLVSLGRSAESMISQISGAVFNIIFDWLLIFGIGPFPEMGIRGAALATVLGQMLSAVIALYYVLRSDSGIRFRLKEMLPTKAIVGGIYSVGIPSMITISLNSVMSFALNQILLTFSTTAAAVLGVWMKLHSFGFMPVFGMNNGTIAIFSYNYGAGKIDRVRKTLKLALIVGFIVSLAVMIIYEFIPVTLMKLFDASPAMLEIGIPAVRICAVTLPIGALAVIYSSCFQSLGRPHYSLFVNLCRQVIFMLPFAWLLSLTGVLQNVWIALPIGEAISLLCALYLNTKIKKLMAEKEKALNN